MAGPYDKVNAEHLTFGAALLCKSAQHQLLAARLLRCYWKYVRLRGLCRLGVGVKPLALRRLMEQYATKARIFVDKRGKPISNRGA